MNREIDRSAKKVLPRRHSGASRNPVGARDAVHSLAMNGFLGILFTISLFHYSLSLAANTGASFLKIGAGARALGMGSAFVATADDATAAYWNPAGLSQLEAKEVGATHTEWFGDIQHDYVTYAHPTSLGTFAGSASYLSHPELEGRTENRQRSGNFGASDVAVGLSFSRSFALNSAYGVTGKILEQRIAGVTAKGVAFDVGVMHRISDVPITLALAATNIGPGMKFLREEYQLPFTVTAGVGYRLNGHLRAEADVSRRIHEGKTQASVGFEYWLGGQIALRSGYLAALAGSNDRSGFSIDGTGSRFDHLTGFNAGLGLKLFGQQIDYALTTQGELGSTHRISLSFRF